MMRRCSTPSSASVVAKAASELATVIGHHGFDVPAAPGEFGDDAVGEFRGPPRFGVFHGTDMELSPAVRGADVEGGVLPDRSLWCTGGARRRAVHLDELTGPGHIEVSFRWRGTRLGFGWRRVLGDPGRASARVLSP